MFPAGQAESQSAGGRIGRARAALIGALSIILGGLVVVAPQAAPVQAHGGDYKLDFTAAAPNTYDHSTGGGAYDDRTVGVNKDIVESLEGGDFKCGDTVTYLTRISRSGTLGAPGHRETLRMQFSFLMDTTGQSGVAMFPVTFVGVNYGVVQGGDGPGGIDLGMIDDSGSTATEISQVATGPIFTKGSELLLTVEVDDLETGEKVILRVDVFLDCDPVDFRPTGNLQAQLNFTDVVASTGPGTLPSRVPGGEQTVPFKQVGRIVYAPPAASFANLSSSTSRLGAGVAAPGSGEVQTSHAPAAAAPASETAAEGFRSGPASPSASLPATGSSGTSGMVQFAVLLLAMGVLGLVAARRRLTY